MTLAHIAGVPVEELGQPVLIALMLSGAWLSTRVRRPRRSRSGAIRTNGPRSNSAALRSRPRSRPRSWDDLSARR
jgi:hypothetical protein